MCIRLPRHPEVIQKNVNEKLQTSKQNQQTGKLKNSSKLGLFKYPHILVTIYLFTKHLLQPIFTLFGLATFTNHSLDMFQMTEGLIYIT